MSAPPLTASASVPARTPTAEAQPPAPGWRLPLAACVVLAAASLLLPSEPTYDPWAWIIWGREVTEADLVTTSGPSWKPLPMFFTVPFALAGEFAPELWLVVARAGGLFAIVVAFRLGARLAGPAAGAIAALGLLLSDEFVRNFARGNSEGILVAVCLWAVERHLDGRRRDAFLLLTAAALLRPEVWPFFGLYGLWLGWTEPRTRKVVGGAFALTGLLWFVPEYIGSGNLLRAAERARDVNPDSAGAAEHPFLEVFERSAPILMVPILVGGVLATVAAVLRLRARRHDRADVVLLALAAGSTILMLAVAAMTQAGFAGNLRYVALPAAGVCVLAGAGWVLVVRAAASRFGARAGAAAAALLVAAAVPFVLGDLRGFRDDMKQVRSEADFYADLDRAIRRSGGAGATNRCGTVVTGPYQVQALAWRLHRHGDDVELEGGPPGTVFAPRYNDLSRDERFARVADTTKWIVRRTCST